MMNEPRLVFLAAKARWALAVLAIAALVLSGPAVLAGAFAAPERIGLFLLVDTLRFPDSSDGVQYTYHGPRPWTAVVQVYPAGQDVADAAGVDLAGEAEAVRTALERLEQQGLISRPRVVDEGARRWSVAAGEIPGRRLAVSYRRDGSDRRGFIYILGWGPEIVKIRLLAEDGGVEAREAERFVELAFAG